MNQSTNDRDGGGEPAHKLVVDPISFFGISTIQMSVGLRTACGRSCTHVDKRYRGHNHPNKYRIWITGQVRRTTVAIKREMKRRAAVEPIIGHMKAEHRMNRNYLKGRDGDRINAVMAAVGFNFHLLLRWLQSFLCAWIQALLG
jgi:IS5 family transposase